MNDTRAAPPAGYAGAMVPIAIAPDAIRAHLLVSLLDSLGVEAHVVGEHTASLGAYGGGATASVMVRADDYGRGLEALTSFIQEREAEERASGTAIRKLDTCPACNYDMRGLDIRTRCPECGMDQDTFTQLKQWIQLAPTPRQPGASGGVGGAIEATGSKLGFIVLGIAAVGLIFLIVALFRK